MAFDSLIVDQHVDLILHSTHALFLVYIPISMESIYSLGEMFKSPLWTGCLPASTAGPQKSIGYAYIKTPPRVAHTEPWPKHSRSKESVLKVEQVGYALYYPCSTEDTDTAGARLLSWLPEPVGKTVLGYQKFLNRKGLTIFFKGVQYVVGRLRFQAYPDAPLLDPASTDTSRKLDKYPLVIFSHGLAGTRNTYSQYCTNLASQGYIVLAIEHRDGSAPLVTLRPGDDGKSRVLYYVRGKEVVWEEEMEDSAGLERFRKAQLEMRVREVYEAFWSFKALLGEGGDGDGREVESGMEADEWTRWIASFKDKVDFDQVDLTGHSFGAGTMLHLVNTPHPDQLPALPVHKVIALDPWLEPIPVPTASSPVPNQPRPPTLIINSPQFTEWEEHFPRLVQFSKDANATLVTLLGTNHQSFSDFPFLAPSAPQVAMGYLATIAQLSITFITGRSLPESEFIKDKDMDQGEYAKNAKGKMQGEPGTIVVHLLGEP